MKIDIVSAVPQLLDGILNESILKRGMEKSLIEINIHDLRKWTSDKHKTVDDTPYGGGPGMILKAEPYYLAIEELKTGDSLVIITTPRGKVLKQPVVHELLQNKHLIILCGHYKAMDERIYNFVDLELSIGDYILTGGEIPAAAIVDSVCRLVPGVISDIDSALSDSFENTLLDCSYYTRPYEFKGVKVPDTLISGNHKKIDEWRLSDSIEITKKKRPDLYEKYLNNRTDKKK